MGGINGCYTNMTLHCQPNKIFVVVGCGGHGDRISDPSGPMPNAAGH